ncbi:phosphoribosylglycinamide formyltransferase [Candidatus Pelagibacter sp.]|nr:phosphoribosylglycinamide formyltransferase [Candidatus Pelagibacter sp.]
MRKLNGKFLKYNIAIFISGRGSNLQSIINYSLKNKTKYNVKIVISNKQKAKGLSIAKKNGIKNYFMNFTKSRKLGNLVLNDLKKNKIKLVCLAGFMRILPDYFIKSYNGKIINIHPSLLPKYKGLNTHKRVIKNKEKFTGCTVHYVNKYLDSGRIISQKKIKINSKDTEKTIEKKVLRIEHKMYPLTINKILTNL